jgi:hypothetical protein
VHRGEHAHSLPTSSASLSCSRSSTASPGGGMCPGRTTSPCSPRVSCWERSACTLQLISMAIDAGIDARRLPVSRAMLQGRQQLNQEGTPWTIRTLYDGIVFALRVCTTQSSSALCPCLPTRHTTGIARAWMREQRGRWLELTKNGANSPCVQQYSEHDTGLPMFRLCVRGKRDSCSETGRTRQESSRVQDEDQLRGDVNERRQ